MRAFKSNRHWIATSLAAAGCAAFSGTHAVRGDFNVGLYDMGTQILGANQWEVYVLTATNNGVNGTGSTLAAVDITIDTGGPSTFNSQTGALGIDDEIAGGSGKNAIFNANLNGSTAIGASPFGGAVFGQVYGGTFIGIGNGAFTTDTMGNSIYTLDNIFALYQQGGANAVFVNAQTTEFTPSGNIPANFIDSFLNKSPSLDSAFENGIQPNATINLDGQPNALVNGTVHSLEVRDQAIDSNFQQAFVPDDPGNGPVPFANIVVQFGTSFTVHGSLTSETGKFNAPTPLAVSLGPSIASVSLAAAPTSDVGVATITMKGSDGIYAPQTDPQVMPAGFEGYFEIRGFNPANDVQVFGLDVVGALSISQFYSDLQKQLQLTNPGAMVFAPNISTLLANGDNVEIVFPSASTPDTATEFLSFDFGHYHTNGFVGISQLTVLPEPGPASFLLAGGSVLLRRRGKLRKIRG